MSTRGSHAGLDRGVSVAPLMARRSRTVARVTPEGQRLAVFLPSLAGGGAERAMVNLAAGFADRGYATDLVLAKAEGPYLSSVPANVRIVDLNVDRVLRALRPLAAYLRRDRPVGLVAALNHANLVAMLAAQAPGVTTRVGISIQNTLSKELRERDRLLLGALPWLFKLFGRFADSTIAVSKGVADDFARTVGVARSRVDVVHNAIITPALFAAAARTPDHPWFERGSQPVVLGAGRLTSQKNFRMLIDAFASVSRDHDARLVIIGEGPERAALEAQARGYGLSERISLPGFVENPYSCMARAAVFVLSSDFEGLPTVLIESLAVGTPVVATDCESGPREILQGGALGEMVPVGDARALAGAIARALDRPRTPPPSEALRSYTVDAVVDAFEAIFTTHA